MKHLVIVLALALPGYATAASVVPDLNCKVLNYDGKVNVVHDTKEIFETKKETDQYYTYNHKEDTVDLTINIDKATLRGKQILMMDGDTLGTNDVQCD